MGPKAKRGRKPDKEVNDTTQESNKKPRKTGGKKTKVKNKSPEELEDEFATFVEQEKSRVMKEFEEQKESVTENTDEYEQMIREVMWDDIRETEEDLDSNLENIAGKYSLEVFDDGMAQEEMLKELENKKDEVTEAMEKVFDDACSRLREAEQNAGEDNAAEDPDNGGITHLSLGFGYGRGGRGGRGGW